MVYNNFYLRLVFSILLILCYLIANLNIYFIFILGLIIYSLIYREIFLNFKDNLIFIIIYVSFSFLSFSVYVFTNFDIQIFNIFISTIIIFDTFSYFNGKLFGKNIIFKKISPKKTLEGYLGGLFCTNIISFIYFKFLNLDIQINFLIFINLIILFSLLGDLIQSYFKRINKIKDSSNFLPGHGGFFDRFDSFISSIIFICIYTNL